MNYTEILKTAFLLFSIFTIYVAKSQTVLPIEGSLLNNGFEDGKDGQLVPKNWLINNVDEVNLKLDTEEFVSGKTSLRISRDSVSEDNGSVYVFQHVPISAREVSQNSISVYIKTSNLMGNVGLYCQMLDGNGIQIGYSNLETKDVIINGTNDWKEYKMTVWSDKRVAKLVVGGYLIGSGVAWFDDFKIRKGDKVPVLSSTEVSAYINRVITLVKQNSLFSDRLDWNEISEDIKNMSRGIQNISEARFLIDYILSKLKTVGDKHSFFQAPTVAKKYRSGGSVQRPTSKLVNGNIGYINVPRFSNTNQDSSKKFAGDIQFLIKQLDDIRKIKGWIIDLRDNSGGAMYPMIAGLGPILGNRKLGYFVSKDQDGQRETPWYYSNGRAGLGKMTIVKVDNPYEVRNIKARVAVLIGPHTSSSGEMTAMSFIGRRNTMMIGSPTAGYTTGNAAFKLPDGAYLYLSTTYSADRNGTKYLNGISPDIPVQDSQDKIIEKAADWLLQ